MTIQECFDEIAKQLTELIEDLNIIHARYDEKISKLENKVEVLERYKNFK